MVRRTFLQKPSFFVKSVSIRGASFRIDCISFEFCRADETPVRWKPMLIDVTHMYSMSTDNSSKNL